MLNHGKFKTQNYKFVQGECVDQILPRLEFGITEST